MTVRENLASSHGPIGEKSRGVQGGQMAVRERPLWNLPPLSLGGHSHAQETPCSEPGLLPSHGGQLLTQ